MTNRNKVESSSRPGQVVSPAPAPASGTSVPTDPVATATQPPAAKGRHGIYFFILFVLPLVAIFLFVLLRGNGQ